VASLTAVVLLLVLSRVDKSIEALAYSVVAGALVAAVTIVIRVFKLLGRPSITLSVLSSFHLLRRLGRTSIAQIVAGLVPQAPTPIERLVGFNLGVGVISSLNYGRVLVSPPLLIGQSIATASYPRFVEHKAREEPSRYQALGRSIGMVTFLLLPLSVVIIGLARSLVELVYHHGAFDQQAVTRTTVAAAILGAALVPIAVGGVLTRFLYAERASERVALASVGTLVLYAVMAVVLGSRFGYAGLAVASTGSYVLLMLSLLWLVGAAAPSGLGFLPGAGLLRTAVASGLSGVAVWLVAGVAGQHAGVVHSLATIAVGGLIGLAAYVLASLALRSSELTEAIRIARRTLLLRHA
jgi:putative peptidoglycan lipid II flippase